MVQGIARPMLWAWLVASCGFAAALQGAEPEVPVSDRLEAILAWNAAADEAADTLMVAALADDREIDGASLNAAAKEVWTELRSHTNVEISVSRFAVHQLAAHPEPAKKLLVQRIVEFDKQSTVDRAESWSFDDAVSVGRQLHALFEVHQSELLKKNIIGDTQVVMTLEREAKGALFRAHSSATQIVGYVDHRDPAFAPFVSGKAKGGKDLIVLTRENMVDLAKAIGESAVEGEFK